MGCLATGAIVLYAQVSLENNDAFPDRRAVCRKRSAVAGSGKEIPTAFD